jgi:hypothetical protein
MDVHPTGHAEPRYGLESPVYRVNFWELPAPGYAFNLDAYVLTDVADVGEAQAWVARNARGRPHELFLELEWQPIGPGFEQRTAPLVRLAGQNPAEHEHVVTLSE